MEIKRCEEVEWQRVASGQCYCGTDYRAEMQEII